MDENEQETTSGDNNSSDPFGLAFNMKGSVPNLDDINVFPNTHRKKIDKALQDLLRFKL